MSSASTEVDRAARGIAAQQHGIITRQQASDLGLSRHAIDHRLRTGHLVRIERGVFAVAGCPATWHQRVLALVLASGGLASHRCAAVLWGVDGFRPGRPELIVPVGYGFRRAGVIIHESVDFEHADSHRRSGIPVTGSVRTAFDLGTRVPWTRQADAVDDLIRRGLAEWPDFYEWLVVLSARGRNGVGTMRAVLDERYGDRVPDSSWNRSMQRLLVAWGLPVPVAEHEIRTPSGLFVARVDLAYPDLRLAIELQSVRYHLTRDGFERDPVRRNALQEQGWTVLEITWRRYVEDPEGIIAEVNRHRARLRAAG